MEPARVLAGKYCDLTGATYALAEPYFIASYLAGVVEQAEPPASIDQRDPEQLLDESEKAAGYKSVRAEYLRTIRAAMDDYLTSHEAATAHRNAFRRAVVEAFFEAFNAGYKDSGGDPEQQEVEDVDWLATRTEAELGYVGELFQALKQLRDGFAAGEVTAGELRDEVAARSAGYVASLDKVYAEGLLRGAKNIMLTMVGDDGVESCRDCQRNKGKRYSARKWLRIGYPPSRDYECKGYLCQHYLQDDDGNAWGGPP